MNHQRRPAREDLAAAADKTVPDVIGPGLKLLFVGINPGLYSAAIGHHFGRPGNRFWPALHRAGFTPRLLSPYEDQDLLQSGLGITNVVSRASAAADELSSLELEQGGRLLEQKVRTFGPQAVAILGIGVYRSAFRRPRAALGLQPERLGGALAWVLPNPSGLNAHYQLEDLARLFRELRDAI